MSTSMGDTQTPPEEWRPKISLSGTGRQPCYFLERLLTTVTENLIGCKIENPFEIAVFLFNFFQNKSITNKLQNAIVVEIHLSSRLLPVGRPSQLLPFNTYVGKWVH